MILSLPSLIPSLHCDLGAGRVSPHLAANPQVHLGSGASLSKALVLEVLLLAFESLHMLFHLPVMPFLACLPGVPLVKLQESGHAYLCSSFLMFPCNSYIFL